PELGAPGLGGDAPTPPSTMDDEEDDDGVLTPGAGGSGEVCDEVLFPASETIPPRILLVVDKSGSMGEEAVGYPGSKWASAVSSLSAVVTSLSGDVDFGLMLYPDGDADSRVCRAGAREVYVSANNAGAIVSELEATTPGGGTPTAKTLEQAQEQLSLLPASGGSRVVVLATDGGPNCNTGLNPGTCRCVQPGQCSDARNCLDDVEAKAAASSLNAAGFSVFVIGIPGSENFTDVLNGLAEAGGTALPGATRYYQANNANGLASALENIASRVATCRFDLARAVPPNADITVTAGGAPVVADPTRTNGWALVDSDTIEFFGAACNNLVNSPANVQIDACYDPSGGG
ncbi:MAG: vWA domain-containing protein, partial [Myxococcota bacterium]